MGAGQRGSGTSRRYAWSQLAKLFRPMLGVPVGFGDGREFFVDASAPNAGPNNDGTEGYPLNTIDAAINKCTGGRGDVIYVSPRHNEGGTAASLFDADVEDISIIGLGSGGNKPTIDFDDTDVTCDVGASNITIKNLRFRASTSAVAVGLSIGAFDNTRVIDCDFVQESTGDEFTSAVSLAGANGDNTLIQGCNFDQGDANAAAQAILVDADCSGVRILNNRIVGTYTAGGIVGATGDVLTDCVIQGNYIKMAADEDPCIKLIGTDTGDISGNTLQMISTSTTTAPIAGGACHVHDNQVLGSTGRKIYVHSGTGGATTVASGFSRHDPVSLVDVAIGLCRASVGDKIVVMAGHAETITNTLRWTCDIAGITIEGEGDGPNRPVITFGTDTTADINVTAAGLVLKNLIFTTAKDQLANMLDLDNGGVLVENCRFESTAATNGAINFVDMATTKDDFTFRNCEFFNLMDPNGTDAAAGTGALFCVDSEKILVDNCRFHGNFETGVIHNRTTKCQNLFIKDSYMENLLSGGELLHLVADVTGGMTNCLGFVPAAADIAVANIIGVIGNKFWVNRNCGFGNDSGGGQLAAFGDAEAS